MGLDPEGGTRFVRVQMRETNLQRVVQHITKRAVLNPARSRSSRKIASLMFTVVRI